MLTIKELQNIVSLNISNIDFDKEPLGLYEPISYTMKTGGKRIRPALCLAGCNLFSDDITSAYPVASAFEIFHNFTLLHDDIMDNSPMRRNKKTVHKKWNINTAILSGDAMMIKSYELLSDLSPELLKVILPLFNKTALQVCEGQQYDMDFESKEDVSEAEYLNMIKLKTSVLIAASIKAGAVCGGASEYDADLLYEFGLNTGLAFQLKDDLLDVYGDTALFGKKTGNDIITGKKTFLLINALQNSDNKTYMILKDTVKSNEISNEDKIKIVTQIYDALQIKELTLTKIKEFHNKALQSLEAVSVGETRKSELYEFVSKLKEREK